MRSFFIALALALFAVPAHAEVSLSGTFTADEACPAYQSFNRQTNPGNITTEAGQGYELIAGNTATPSHYRIIVEDAEPKARWVAVSCGTTEVGSVAHDGTGDVGSVKANDYLLAVSWQPAFCETHADKAECRDQQPDSFEASNFTLHGLWPQPNGTFYCTATPSDRAADERNRWFDIAPVVLSDALRQALDEAMPGTQSALERHEWAKHGTCYGTDAEEYFADSLLLLEALNSSEVGALFADNIGKQVTLDQLRAAFDTAFGPGSGERVRMACTGDGRRELIGEIFIALRGEVTDPVDLPALLAAAPTEDQKCRIGEVDAVGFQ